MGTASSSTQEYVPLDSARFKKSINGKEVGLFSIANARGMRVALTNYGARIEQILVPDRNGKIGDVVQGYESIDQVVEGQGSMGAFIGRYANRIAKGRFSLGGKTFQLGINNGPNSLHGGVKGSRFVVFDAKRLSPSSVQMSYVFSDGEEGYPGTVPLRVVYSVTPDNALVIAYDAVAVDKDTVINFTSHPFFNLSGDLGSSVLDHLLEIKAERVLEIDETLVPTGRERLVAGTPMDFLSFKALGAEINMPYDLLTLGGGYDHAYVIAEDVSHDVRHHASLKDPKSGRVLTVLSTEPGMQLCTGNFLEGKAPRDIGKGGVAYGFRSCVCLEPQHHPDSPNHSSFPSTVLRKGEWYSGTILYQFSTD